MSAEPPVAPKARVESLDVARGALLVAMVIVHVVSGHATAAQSDSFHAWLGVFLISCGFVMVSGVVVGSQPGPLSFADATRAVDRFLQLLLVMFGFGVLFSLARYGFAQLAGPPAACVVRAGWRPPLRFEDIGILLPIAIVQLFAPVARLSRRSVAVGAGVILAIGWALFPAATAGASDRGVGGALVGALARQTLTPYFAVSSYVAFGIVGGLLGRLAGPFLRAPRSFLLSSSALLGSIVLAAPASSASVLGAASRYVAGAGFAAAVLAYWTFAVSLFLIGFAHAGSGRRVVRRVFALVGRHSLFFFVLQDLLLEVGTFLRDASGAPAGIPLVAALCVLDVGLLLLCCSWLERSARARTIATVLLLGRSRVALPLRAGAFSLSGAVFLAGVLGVYCGFGRAPRGDGSVSLDDFEGRAGCPDWWTSGSYSQRRVPGRRGRFLEVRGSGSSRDARSVRGLYLRDDAGRLRALELDVEGHGPTSGRMRIELAEDDNGNWEIERDRPGHLLFDDCFVQELIVDWVGWRRVVLPLGDFRDGNPGVGNDRFDPRREGGSGGLLDLRIFFAALGGPENEVRLGLDNLRWIP